MKTVAEIARELGVSKQAIHKRLKQEPLKTQLQGLTAIIDNSLRFDAEGETLVKSAFGRNEPTTVFGKCVDGLEIGIDEVSKEVDEMTNKVDEALKNDDKASTEIVQVLKDEITLLISQNEDLRRQLNEERAHNRELSEKMLPLIEQAQKITENAQTLHAMDNIKPQLSNGEKRGFFNRIFKR